MAFSGCSGLRAAVFMFFSGFGAARHNRPRKVPAPAPMALPVYHGDVINHIARIGQYYTTDIRIKK
jgi:hypothetical protein